MHTALLIAVAIQSIDPSAGLTDAELKHFFLVCDESANQQLLDNSDAAACSTIYEQLKQRVFGGDSKALFEWWQQAREKAPPK